MKKLALFSLLSLVPLHALAAASVTTDGIVNLVVYMIIIGIVFGLLFFLVDRAPFIPPEWKTVIKYVIIFIAVLFLINLLLGLVGHPIITLR